MGMYDNVVFGTGNTEAELTNNNWQTKDLYNSLFTLVIQDDQLFYQEDDVGKTLHKLPYTGAFEIHALTEECVMLERLVTVVKGDLIDVGLPKNSDYFGLPTLEAMARDLARCDKSWGNTLALLQKLKDERTLFDKVKMNVRAALFEFKNAFQSFGRGVRKLFGVG